MREIRPEVPEALADLVGRMLSKAQEARPRDGAAFVRELAALEALDRQALSARSPPREVLTGGERRLLTIVIALPSPEDVTLTTGMKVAGAAPRELMVRLRAIMEAFGARLEPITGGGVVAALSGAGSPTDQATFAARCALRMRVLLPWTPIALFTR